MRASVLPETLGNLYLTVSPAPPPLNLVADRLSAAFSCNSGEHRDQHLPLSLLQSFTRFAEARSSGEVLTGESPRLGLRGLTTSEPAGATSA